MTVDEHVIGKDSKPYVNLGTVASPTWTLMDHTGNLNVGLSKNEAEIADRELAWEMFGAGRKRAEITFDYLHEKGANDTVFAALLASFTSDTPYQFAFLDQLVATTGAKGLSAPMLVFQLEQTQELDNAIMYSVTLKVARMVEAGAVVAPAWMVVAP